MSETIQQRRARIDAQFGNPPTIAQVTASAAAQTAANLAETKAHRDGRHELRKQAPDWKLMEKNLPESKR